MLCDIVLVLHQCQNCQTLHPLVTAAVRPDGGGDSVPGAGGPHRVRQPPHPGSRVMSWHMMIHFILISHYIILTYSFGAVHKVRYHNTGANVLWFQMSSVLLSHISGSHVHFMSKSSLQSCNRILYGQSLAAYYCLSCDWLLIWPTEGPAIVIVVVCSSPVSSQAHTFTIKLTTMCVSIFLNNIYQ